MIRKLSIILLGGAICLLGVTSALAVKYNEAPMLRVQVAAGELPPVEERIPEEPKVIKPLEEIGQYGGTLNIGDLGPFNAIDARELRVQGLFEISNDGTKVLPNVAKGYDLSEDKKTLTIFLRKGLKWSDGYPLTVDDILFWWEDITLNKEVTPVVPGYWKSGGKLPEFEKIDDYTLRIHFPLPYPNVMSTLGHNWMSSLMPFCPPKHYLKKFHKKYNPEADKLAKERGFDSWNVAIGAIMNAGYYRWNFDPNIPTFDTYVIKEIAPNYQIWERNSYFWAVDTEGNQLPYIDRYVGRLYEDKEVLVMKILSGEIDLSAFNLGLEDYPVLKKNEEKGNYRTTMWKGPYGSICIFAPNQNHPDPVMRRINQDLRFREALSLAINREEIDEVVFFGLSTPRQLTVNPSVSYFKEEWGKAYAEYNPEKANRLLDEMGLKWNETQESRLRPDGKSLAITIEYYPAFGSQAPICELVKEYWEDIGIKVVLKSEDRQLYQERSTAGVLDLGIWNSDGTTELLGYGFWASMLNLGGTMASAIKWQQWKDTGGEKGEEPPEHVKRLFELEDKWWSATTREKYISLAQEIYDWHAKYLFFIGTVGMPPFPVVVKNNLRNVPEEAYFGWEGDFWASVEPETFFFKK